LKKINVRRTSKDTSGAEMSHAGPCSLRRRVNESVYESGCWSWAIQPSRVSLWRGVASRWWTSEADTRCKMMPRRVDVKRRLGLTSGEVRGLDAVDSHPQKSEAILNI